MIKIKKAPAGLIAQLYSDDIRQEVNGEPVLRQYLGVCGQWSTTEEDAIKSMEADCAKWAQTALKKIERLRAQIKGLERHIQDLKDTDRKHIEYE